MICYKGILIFLSVFEFKKRTKALPKQSKKEKLNHIHIPFIYCAYDIDKSTKKTFFRGSTEKQKWKKNKV